MMELEIEFGKALAGMLGINNMLGSNYYKMFSHTMANGTEYSTKMLFVEATGGYRGGNCWGDRAYPYTVEESEIQESIYHELKYRLEQIEGHEQFLISNWQTTLKLKIEAEIRRHDTVEDDGVGEYYGNNTDYGLFQLDLDELMSCISDMSQEHVRNSIEYAKLLSNLDYEIKKLNSDIENATKLIANFEEDSAKELEKFQKEIDREEESIKKALNRIKRLKSSISNHVENRNKVKESLVSQIEEKTKRLNMLKANPTETN